MARAETTAIGQRGPTKVVVVATGAELRSVTIEHHHPSLTKATVASNLPRFTVSLGVVLATPSATIKARTIAAMVAFVAAAKCTLCLEQAW